MEALLQVRELLLDALVVAGGLALGFFGLEALVAAVGGQVGEVGEEGELGELGEMRELSLQLYFRTSKGGAGWRW